MSRMRSALVIVCAIVLWTFAASLVSADTVSCNPIVRNGVVVGYCFVVCNELEAPCIEAGCIYDLHLQITSKGCVFATTVAVPVSWVGSIPSSDPTLFDAMTPAPTGGPVSPIQPGRCKRFCLRVRCSEPLDCFYVSWQTTDIQGQVLDQGRTRCCHPVTGG